jgi:hypothetical protein
VVVWRGEQPELEEDRVDVRLDRLRAEEQRLADRTVRPALGHQAEDLALARRQLLERVVVVASTEQLCDDVRIDDGAAVRDPSHGPRNSSSSTTRSFSR